MRNHEQVRSVDTVYNGASPVRVGFPESLAPVTLNTGARSSPILSVDDTAERSRCFVACARFNPRDHLRLSSEIHDLHLRMLGLSRVQIFQCIQETSKIVVLQRVSSVGFTEEGWPFCAKPKRANTERGPPFLFGRIVTPVTRTQPICADHESAALPRLPPCCTCQRQCYPVALPSGFQSDQSGNDRGATFSSPDRCEVHAARFPLNRSSTRPWSSWLLPYPCTP